jgi:hypothetical protein
MDPYVERFSRSLWRRHQGSALSLHLIDQNYFVSIYYTISSWSISSSARYIHRLLIQLRVLIANSYVWLI